MCTKYNYKERPTAAEVLVKLNEINFWMKIKYQYKTKINFIQT